MKNAFYEWMNIALGIYCFIIIIIIIGTSFDEWKNFIYRMSHTKVGVFRWDFGMEPI